MGVTVSGMSLLEPWTAAVSAMSWYALHFVVARARLPRSADARAQYEWYHAIAYPVLTALAVLAIVREGAWDPHALARSSFTHHVVSAQIGFFIAGVLLAFTSSFRRVPASLVHHVVSTALFASMMLGGRYPVIVPWVMAVQVTGVFFHPMKLLGLGRPVAPNLAAALERIHLCLFLGVRVVGYSLATTVFLWRDAASPLFEVALWKPTVWIALSSYVMLHLLWARALLRSRDSRQVGTPWTARCPAESQVPTPSH